MRGRENERVRARAGGGGGGEERVPKCGHACREEAGQASTPTQTVHALNCAWASTTCDLAIDVELRVLFT